MRAIRNGGIYMRGSFFQDAKFSFLTQRIEKRKITFCSPRHLVLIYKKYQKFKENVEGKSEKLRRTKNPSGGIDSR